MGGSLSLVKGTLDLLVLKALSCGMNHGYGIVRWLEEGTDGELEVADSALYQALHRLDGRGQVTAEWRVTDTGRRARFYRITPSGRRTLDREGEHFRRYAAMVNGLLALDADAGA